MALPKTLQQAIDRSGLFTDKCYQDSDGYWLLLRPGFIGPFETHEIHDLTVKECLWQIKDVRPCDCAKCVEAKETMSDVNEPGAPAGDLHRDGGRMA